MTMSIPRAKRICVLCKALSPSHSSLNEDEKHKVWNRSDLCPDCFSKQESAIFWKRSRREKVKSDVSGMVAELKEFALSVEPLDQCTGLLLAEFLVRKQILKRVSQGHFRFKDSDEELIFERVDFPRELFLEAQSRI